MKMRSRRTGAVRSLTGAQRLSHPVFIVVIESEVVTGVLLSHSVLSYSFAVVAA